MPAAATPPPAASVAPSQTRADGWRFCDSHAHFGWRNPAPDAAAPTSAAAYRVVAVRAGVRSNEALLDAAGKALIRIARRNSTPPSLAEIDAVATEMSAWGCAYDAQFEGYGG